METLCNVGVRPVEAWVVCVIGGAVLSPRFATMAEACEWAQEVACFPASGNWTVRKVG